MRLLFIIFFPLYLFSYDINVGLKAFPSDFEIMDNDSLETVASLNNGNNFLPVLSLQTDDKYIFNSNFGYFILTDWERFRVSKQDPNDDNNVDSINLGTKISGYKIFTIPHIFYHLNKSKSFINLSSKIGLGLGIGYLNAKGDYIITQEQHQDFGEKKQLNISKLGFTYGILFELLFDKHSLVLHNYAVQVSDSKYSYNSLSTSFEYHYKFSF